MLILFMLLVSQFILGVLIYPWELELGYMHILRLVVSFAFLSNVGALLWGMVFG